MTTRMGGEVFSQRMVAPLMGRPCDETSVDKAMNETLPPYFAYLEGRLAGRAWAVGNAFRVADIAIASRFVNLHHAGETVDATQFPALAAFVAKLHARPIFAACIAEEVAFLRRARTIR